MPFSGRADSSLPSLTDANLRLPSVSNTDIKPCWRQPRLHGKDPDSRGVKCPNSRSIKLSFQEAHGRTRKVWELSRRREKEQHAWEELSACSLVLCFISFLFAVFSHHHPLPAVMTCSSRTQVPSVRIFRCAT